LHSHVHHFSGYVLWLGRQAGIPLRISHSHTNTSLLPAALSRKVYLAAMGKLITNNATHLLAASGDAATALFGPRWRQDHRAQVLFCGIDLAPFRRPVDRTDVRSEFGFRPSEPVFGHVGRFDMAKNHRFLVEIAAEIVRREPNARFLFVGDGPLRSEIEIQLRATGIRDRVILTGSRPDVPRLLLGAMDAFLFPSRWEGLSLALVEAQAAGLPAIVSDSMPMEADVVPDLINRQSLRQPAAVWAESALHHRHRSTPGTLDIIEGSPFNVITSAKKLSKLYSGE
jgi:glycosyltransferase involved in cell wall biosynthesis